jgi:hypothetical protein
MRELRTVEYGDCSEQVKSILDLFQAVTVGQTVAVLAHTLALLCLDMDEATFACILNAHDLTAKTARDRLKVTAIVRGGEL